VFHDFSGVKKTAVESEQAMPYTASDTGKEL